MAYYAALHEKSAEEAPVRLVLDMLRYDEARVLAFNYGYWLLRFDQRRPTFARWQSMGLSLWMTRCFVSVDDLITELRASREGA